MRRSTCASLCLIALASMQLAHAAELRDMLPDKSVETRPDKSSLELLPPGTAQPADSDGTSVERDFSRYRWHEGRWWYQLTNRQWLVWTDDCWRSASAPPQAPKPNTSLRQSAGYHEPSNLPPALRSTNHGWVGGFYSSGGGYGSADFGYGYGIRSYGPYRRP